MPELPEVETTVQGLKRYIEGKIINRAVFHRDNIRYPLNKAWITAVGGCRILHIRRRAKLIVMHLDNGLLLWHLGMTGSLRVSHADEAKRRHDHIECCLSDGRILRFHDPRRFGYLKWFADQAALEASIAHYGVEPLSADFNADRLWQQSRRKRQAVKSFIMNQHIVVGVGNIYACEALFAAAIHPQTPCGNISRARYQRLITAVQQILQKAIAEGGTTLKDFENADAKPGYFQQSLTVYGRKNQPCPQCQTTIKAEKIGGRNSFYCPTCQRG